MPTAQEIADRVEAISSRAPSTDLSRLLDEFGDVLKEFVDRQRRFPAGGARGHCSGSPPIDAAQAKRAIREIVAHWKTDAAAASVSKRTAIFSVHRAETPSRNSSRRFKGSVSTKRSRNCQASPLPYVGHVLLLLNRLPLSLRCHGIPTPATRYDSYEFGSIAAIRVIPFHHLTNVPSEIHHPHHVSDHPLRLPPIGKPRKRPNLGPAEGGPRTQDAQSGREWAYEGTLRETKLGPGGKFAGQDASRWILDGLFMESRDKDKGVYGGKEMTYEGVTIHWYDAATKTYKTRSFDNDGVVSEGSETVNGKTWTSTGTGVGSKGQKLMNRNTTTFAADGRSYTAKSEISFDEGKTWTIYWELTAKKTTP